MSSAATPPSRAEGRSFEAGEGLSPEVEAAVGELADRVLAEVE
jgi:hypothetical protein